MPAREELPPIYAVARKEPILPQMPPRVLCVSDETARAHGLRVEDLTGRSRLFRIAFARQEAWSRIRDLPTQSGKPFSYPKIARWFGRDWSTVVYGVQRHREREASKVAAE